MLDDLVFQSPTIKSKDLAFCRWTPQLQEWERGYRRQMKNWPLWSLFAVALSLSVVLVVPDFREVVVPSGAIALTCAVVVAWIFVLSRAIEPIVKWVSRHRHGRE